MGITIGNKPVTDIYVGSTAAKAKYKGSTKVWEPFSTEADEEFLYRKSGGDGYAYYKRIKGRTIVWNQLVKGGDFASAEDWTESNCTLSVSNNVLTATATTSPCSFYQYMKITSGHKYLFICSMKASNDTMQLRISNSYGGSDVMAQKNTSWQTLSTIWTSNQGGDLTYPRVYANDIEENETFDVKDVILVDLTLLGFGDLTAAQFKALYPGAYYPYNSGIMKNNDADGIDSTGLNEWDEEWEVGGIYTNTGINYPNASTIRSKNYTPCFPGVAYYLGCTNTSLTRFAIGFIWYDADKNFISGGWSCNEATTSPANAAYFKITTQDASGNDEYGNTYNHDICVNISNAARNGQYMPFWKKDIRLNLWAFDVEDAGGNIKVINGLDGVGTAYDEITEGNKLIKRMGAVNLATLNWTLNSSGVWATSDLLFPGVGAADKAVILAEKYENVVASVANMGTAGRIGGNQWALSCNNGSTVDPPTGLMVYKLATEEHYTLIDPIKQYLQVDVDGTERAIAPSGATTPSAPFVAGTRYQTVTTPEPSPSPDPEPEP